MGSRLSRIDEQSHDESKEDTSKNHNTNDNSSNDSSWPPDGLKTIYKSQNGSNKDMAGMIGFNIETDDDYYPNRSSEI